MYRVPISSLDNHAVYFTQYIVVLLMAYRVPREGAKLSLHEYTRIVQYFNITSFLQSLNEVQWKFRVFRLGPRVTGSLGASPLKAA